MRCLKVLCLLLKAKFKISLTVNIIFTPRNVPRPVADAHHLVKVCALLLKRQRYQPVEIIFFVLFIRFFSHLTSLKPSMAHLALAKGIFTRTLQYNFYNGTGLWYVHRSCTIISKWALEHDVYMVLQFDFYMGFGILKCTMLNLKRLLWN